MNLHLLISFSVLLFVAVHGEKDVEDKKEHKRIGAEIEDLLRTSENVFFDLTNRFDTYFSPSKWLDHYTFTRRPTLDFSPKYKIIDDDAKFEITYQKLQVYSLEDVSVELSSEGHILDVHGEHKTEDDDGKGHQSSSTRKFHHVFKLHPNADINNIVANMSPEGKLVIEVPKLSVEKSREVRSKVPIQIQTNEKARISE